jgi:capsular polysaccharide biosynthesis protein
MANISEGTRFLKFLYRWRKLLLLALVASVIATIIVTLIMPSEYESAGIIFPTPTNSPEKILTEPQFGYEVDADWLMQVLKSDIVKDTLVKLFGLIDYYELDTMGPNWRDELNKKYEKTISFQRTRYMSIEIKAQTKNPELSSDLVNTIIDKIDPIRERIFKENTYRTVIYYEKAMFDKLDLINTMVDSLYDLRNENASASLDKLYRQIKQKQDEVAVAREKLNQIQNSYNFYDLGQYIDILNVNLAEAKAVYSSESGRYEILKESLGESDSTVLISKAKMEGARNNIKQFEGELQSLNSVKKDYTEINDGFVAGLIQLNQLREQYENTLNAFEPFVNSIRLERLANDYSHEQVLLNEIRYKYETALINYQTPIPSVYVINRASPSHEKVSPSWIQNALIIIMATMAFTLGLLLFWEKYREIKPLFHDEQP